MKLTDRDRKLLWAKAGNRCSYRYEGLTCDQDLVVDAGGTDAVVGEECHIVGRNPTSSRYTEDCPNRESYDNGILLCPIHHKIVDDNGSAYSVVVLQEMKRAHEVAVAARAESDDRIDFADSEFVTEVSSADRAVGMEVNRPASFSNVKATLKATDVKEAIGFRTSQSLTGMIVFCPYCNKPVPAGFTGPSPQSVRCPICGRSISLK